MNLKVVLGILFSHVLQISLGHGGTELPEIEDLGKMKQLEHISKTSVKTIKTEHGDIYECVDFFKQPAFNHPALKNHDFHPQMRPSTRTQQLPWASIGLKHKACPAGSVPIRRESEDDRMRIKSLMMNYTSRIHPRSIPLDPGTWVAVGQTKSGDRQVYYGVGANLTIHNPYVFNYEYSSGQIGIQGGSDSIQVGWTVNPILYKDNQTRMFIYTNAGQSHCFNTQCPGFVIVRTDIPLDTVLGTLYQFSYFINQDPVNGNWWLEVGPDYTPIGFWPNRIFTDLAKSGSYVSCGGQAYRKPGVAGGVPNMGSGFKPSKKKGYNAYCFGFFVVDEWHKKAIQFHTEGYTNGPGLYGIKDEFVPAGLRDTVDMAGSRKMDAQDNGTNIVLEFQHRVVYGGTQVLT